MKQRASILFVENLSACCLSAVAQSDVIGVVLSYLSPGQESQPQQYTHPFLLFTVHCFPMSNNNQADREEPHTETAAVSSRIQETAKEGNIRIVPFALLPSSEDPDHGGHALLENSTRRGIVGNVIFFGTSAYVWASWGAVHRIPNTDDLQGSHDTSPPIMGTGLPIMGSLGLAMPRKRYAGMQSDIPSYTQLIGGTNDEDMILGSGMACRLSDKLGFPVFVSLTVAGENNHLSTSENMTPPTLTTDATLDENVRWTVARIEREVTQILLKNQVT